MRQRTDRMNELAGRILFSRSRLTRVIDRMEEAGLVQRERPPDDRRVDIHERLACCQITRRRLETSLS